jgi:hypothetical protein
VEVAFDCLSALYISRGTREEMNPQFCSKPIKRGPAGRALGQDLLPEAEELSPVVSFPCSTRMIWVTRSHCTQGFKQPFTCMYRFCNANVMYQACVTTGEE